MKKIIGLIMLLPLIGKAQNTFTVIIKNEDTQQAIPNATVQVKALKFSAVTNEYGIATFANIPDGKQLFEFTSIGFKEKERLFIFPLRTIDSIFIFLEQDLQQLSEVTVSSTRSNRSITNTPTRVEIIAEEEIHEESTMRPGDIRMLLSESTGIQTQQTSATSANASIRIQGLDGRYTQILKDGFPIYSGAASGLGLLQIPPLDLKQVEIIKGSSSTLYGGGAIAGLVNLITKVPNEKRELNFHANVTSAGGLDLNSFYSQRHKKTGLTLFVARNSNKAYDPANISFSAIPKFQRYTVNPRFFLYLTEKTKLNFGINTTFENRIGGDMKLIQGKQDSTHSFFERNKTNRVSTQFTLNHEFNDENSLSIKNSVSYFNRIINSNGYDFNGTQYSTFTEINFVNKTEENDWVAGLNLVTDQFKEKPISLANLRNYNQTTIGVFVQNTWNVSSRLIIETGLRVDHINSYGSAVLPRISALFKITPELTSRIGGGFGYKPPTIFTEESEKLLFKDILPINASTNNLERSYGANWDINYKTSFDEVTFSLNQFFFYTYLKNPLFLIATASNTYQMRNIEGSIFTKGAETNVKLGYDELALYLGYTYTNAKVYNLGITKQNSLTPKHRFNAALVYEIEGKWKLGSELYYFSKQPLTDGSVGRDYWLAGLVAERLFKKFSVFLNFENIGDVRQTKFGNIYSGTITNPLFKDIYAPLEGFVVNGGLKISL
jgi:outer membrane receptor for ferrienterochelin and colicins